MNAVSRIQRLVFQFGIGAVAKVPLNSNPAAIALIKLIAPNFPPNPPKISRQITYIRPAMALARMIPWYLGNKAAEDMPAKEPQ